MATFSTLTMNARSLREQPNWGARLGEFSVYLIFSVALVVPQVPATSDLNVRSELFVLAAIIFVYAWMLLAGLVCPLRANGMFIAALLFCTSVVISIIYGTDVLHHQLLVRDYFEIPKVWLPAFYFTFAYEVELSEGALKRFLTFLTVPTVLICLFAWGQHFNLDVAYRLNPYYTGGQHIDVALERYNRVYSTFGNPNILGQFLSWTLVIYTSAFLFKVGTRVRNLGIALACMGTMVLTGSRYALLATGLGLLLILFLAASTRKAAAKFVALFLLLGAFSYTFITLQRSAHHQQKRFEELRHPMEVNSLRQRLDGLWLEAGDFITTSPLVGHGPAKQLFTGVFTDSEYLDILKEFGIVGFVPYICFYLWGLNYLVKGLRTGKRLGPVFEERFPANYLMVRVGFVIVLMALFMNVGMFTYLNWELMAFLWLMMGITVRSAVNLISVYESAFPTMAEVRAARIAISSAKSA
jgi:putative inorganic carbon (hco3(-)) transporter